MANSDNKLINNEKEIKISEINVLGEKQCKPYTVVKVESSWKEMYFNSWKINY